jgi:hypothetical protein
MKKYLRMIIKLLAQNIKIFWWNLHKPYADIANEPYRRVWTKPISTYALNYNDISLALDEHILIKLKVN